MTAMIIQPVGPYKNSNGSWLVAPCQTGFNDTRTVMQIIILAQKHIKEVVL